MQRRTWLISCLFAVCRTPEPHTKSGVANSASVPAPWEPQSVMPWSEVNMNADLKLTKSKATIPAHWARLNKIHYLIFSSCGSIKDLEDFLIPRKLSRYFEKKRQGNVSGRFHGSDLFICRNQTCYPHNTYLAAAPLLRHRHQQLQYYQCILSSAVYGHVHSYPILVNVEKTPRDQSPNILQWIHLFCSKDPKIWFYSIDRCVFINLNKTYTKRNYEIKTQFKQKFVKDATKLASISSNTHRSSCAASFCWKSSSLDEYTFAVAWSTSFVNIRTMSGLPKAHATRDLKQPEYPSRKMCC